MSILYIDESKANGYTIVAVVMVSGDISTVRKAIADLRMPGQRRIHFTKESDPRRRLILARLVELGVRVRIYHVAGRNEREARALCLAAIAAEAAESGVTRIVLERDDSIEEQDRRTLYRELEARGIRERIAYSHDTSAGELLLCLPDAVAWSFAKGGDWHRRIDPMIIEVRRLS